MCPRIAASSERRRGTKRGVTGRQRYSDGGVRGTNQSHHKAAAGHTESLGGKGGGKNKESKHPGACTPHLGHMEVVDWATD
jgi:hypothetical protein